MSRRARFSEETKIQALKLKKEVGTRIASEQLGIPMDTIGYWDRQVRDGKLILEGFEKTPENALSVRDENRLLKDRIKQTEKRIAQLEKENDFLKEASAFFAASHPRLKRMRESNI